MARTFFPRQRSGQEIMCTENKINWPQKGKIEREREERERERSERGERDREGEFLKILSLL